ncbi:MAG: LolA-related protein [Rhodospirillales bacterium]
MRRRAGIGVLLILMIGLWPLGPAAAGVLKAGDVIRGEFRHEKHLKGVPKPLVSEGRFILVVPQGLIWFAERPFKFTTVIAPAGIVQVLEGQDPIRLPDTVSTAIASLRDMITATLTGDWKVLQATFDMKVETTATGWSRVFTPRSRSVGMGEHIAEIRLTGADLVQSIKITKVTGDIERLVFLNQNLTRAPVSAAEAELFRLVGKP